MAAINRINYFFKQSSRKDFLALGIKCVFISHQKRDAQDAKKVADYLQNAGIEVYFDEYDSDLRIHYQGGSAAGVTNAICTGINNSSHMLVVVSPNTMLSGWVPFEIGYGYEKTELGVLCLKGIPKGKLPEYVRVVPIIRDIYDLNNLIERLSGKTKEMLFEANLMSDYGNRLNPLSNIMDTIISDQY